MEPERRVRVSKLLSFGLRHAPEALGLALDGAGWADVDAVLAGLAARGERLTRAELEALVAASDKQRFALSPDRARIRAQHGHSVAVDLGLPPATPPERLYHGTVARFLDAIRAGGLLPGARRHVHLSADEHSARIVGARRGAAIVLVVRAAEMDAAGYVFHRSANGVWLTSEVPPQYIQIPPART